MTRVIGIAGGSCSGKTTLARAIVARHGASALVFGLDAYYRDQSGKPWHEINVDEPSALDDALLVSQAAELAAGGAVEQPVYDYRTHARTSKTRRLGPADLVVVEGLFALYWPALRELYDASMFVDLDHDACLARRVERDVRERGRTVEQVNAQYRNDVQPMFEKYVAPTRVFAGRVLDGALPPGDLLAAVLPLI